MRWIVFAGSTQSNGGAYDLHAICRSYDAAETQALQAFTKVEVHWCHILDVYSGQIIWQQRKYMDG